MSNPKASLSFTNENFLFSNKSLAEKYEGLRNELSAQRKEVEGYEETINN